MMLSGLSTPVELGVLSNLVKKNVPLQKQWIWLCDEYDYYDL